MSKINDLVEQLKTVVAALESLGEEVPAEVKMVTGVKVEESDGSSQEFVPEVAVAPEAPTEEATA